MYDTAKKAREALKSKARRLASGTTEKVSSSDWTPPEPLNADVKTGMRPVSRKRFKAGGKVDGSCGPMRADRKPRKAGGKAESEKAEAKQYANAKVNRDVKAANEEREGIKHVGGLKAGGRAAKMRGGVSYDGKEVVSPTAPKATTPAPAKPAPAPVKPESKPMTPEQEAAAKKAMDAQVDRSRQAPPVRKAGGRTKKMMGGGMFNPAATMGAAGQPMNPQPDPRQNVVSPNSFNFIGNPVTPGVSGMKKGGKVARKDGGKVSHMEWEHSKQDLAEDKKLAKKHGMSLEQWEKSAADKKHDKQQSMKGLDKADRTARKDGGRTKSKGKTNIAIVINAGEKAKAPGADMGAPPIVGPDAMPIPVPPKGAMPAAMPMPMPAPGGMPPMPPMGGAGAPPLPRKAGGRITKKASSYKDMEAGAASGEGRLQKTDIAAKQPKPGLKRGVIESDNKGYPNKVNGAVGGRTARKVGGRTYRSYKDMDAGAGSGKGRLEKTEIEAHKS